MKYRVRSIPTMIIFKNGKEAISDGMTKAEEFIHVLTRMKFFSTQIYFQLNYDKAQNSSVQMYSMLTLGLTYTFKNK